MYTVSQDYISKMFDQVQTHHLSGLVGSAAFTEADVIGVSYTNKCSDKKVSLGSVNIGVLKLTFLSDILNRGDYFGQTISLSDVLVIDPEDETTESVPVGVFTIADAKWTQAGMVNVTAYDCLSKMDKPLPINQSSGKVYDFCKYIEHETGAVFGMTEAECDLLPNGEDIISPFAENNMTTYRDLLSALAEFIGGFATANRDGTWRLQTFDDTSILTFPKNRRMSGTTFSDFTTYYDTIQYTDLISQTTKYVGDEQGLTMNLGSQPFLQYGTTQTIRARLESIIEQMKKMVYTPFDVSGLPAFVALDLGDVITLSNDYSGGSSVGAVMSLSWTYNKTVKMSCYGENPNLRSAQSATDKNIAGLLSRTDSKSIQYYTFENVADIEDITDEEVIGSFYFATLETTTVTMWHEIQADFTLDDESEPMQVIVHYYLNGEEEAYTPIMTIGESGVHTLDYNYFLKGITGGLRNEWTVTLECVGGSADIGIDNVHICLTGQGLVGADSFLGLIEVSEEIPLFVVHGIAVGAFSDSAVLTHDIDNDKETASDNIGLFDFDYPSQGFSESVTIYMDSGIFDRITEDGDNRVTEDGNRRITE